MLFIVYIASLSLYLKMLIYPVQKAQIALLIIKKMVILAKYWDYTNVFSKDLAIELLERFDINEYAIDLKLGK